MSERKWMPGPWVFEGRPPNVTLFFSGTVPGNRLSPCALLDGDQIATANLIAAAPDLYELLERAQPLLVNVALFADKIGGGDCSSGIAVLCNDISAALLKARGEAS
jgi:hypothetical protein